MDKKLQGIKVTDELYEPETDSKVHSGKFTRNNHDIEITYEISNSKVHSGKFIKNIGGSLLTNTLIIRKLNGLLSLAGSLCGHINNFNSGHVSISKNFKVNIISFNSNVNNGGVNNRISGGKIRKYGYIIREIVNG